MLFVGTLTVKTGEGGTVTAEGIADLDGCVICGYGATRPEAIRNFYVNWKHHVTS